MAIIIGDIHGNVEKVKAFLDYRPDQEHVALGDYVDSFFEPPARQIEALQLLLDSNAVLLWGNHDLHYLAKPPFICTGFQYGREKQYQEIIEAHKYRFVAAYVADGWLCTHAGVHVRLAKRENESEIAARLNRVMAEYHDKPYAPGQHGIFAIGGGRGGKSRSGGIFWFDFKRENGLDLAIKQIFGHTETPEPVINDHYVPKSYVALDTTNNKENCWLYDTEANELIRLPLGVEPAKKDNDPKRLRDLPLEEQEPFKKYLINKCVPRIHGIPDKEQDFYWPADYRRWKNDPDFWSPM